VKTTLVDLQMLRLANHLLQSSVAELRHDLSNFLGQQKEVVDHVLGLA
jgi:hypothetical protein